MKAKILDINGKEKGNVELPKAFSSKVRVDILSKVLEAKKTQQPYAPSPVAGNQHSASGKLVHRRHVWKSQYGRGMSRIPRMRLSRRGSQFNWVGATVPQTRGGRRAHPPKVASFLQGLKMNKKEERIALVSALSASANEKFVKEKYGKLKDKSIKNIPIIIESKFVELKTKERLDSLKKILGEVYDVVKKKRVVRTGKGKMRGRKYKSNAGLLLVTGNSEKVKTTAFDVVPVKNLGVNDLASGGPGRVVVYTENSIKDLAEKLGTET